MELRERGAAMRPAYARKTGPSARDLMSAMVNISWPTLTALLAASVGLALVAVPPVPLLALIIFSVVWAVTLVGLAGAMARSVARRRRSPHAH